MRPMQQPPAHVCVGVDAHWKQNAQGALRACQTCLLRCILCPAAVLLHMIHPVDNPMVSSKQLLTFDSHLQNDLSAQGYSPEMAEEDS